MRLVKLQFLQIGGKYANALGDARIGTTGASIGVGPKFVSHEYYDKRGAFSHPGAPAPGMPFEILKNMNMLQKILETIGHKHMQVTNSHEKFR